MFDEWKRAGREHADCFGERSTGAEVSTHHPHAITHHAAFSVDERGFTFIEIMVVVAILAILAALVVPRIMGRTDDAKRTAAKVQIRNIEGALQLYKLDNGVYPTTEQGLKALVEKPSVGVIPKKWKLGGYLPKLPGRSLGKPLQVSEPQSDSYSESRSEPQSER